MLIAITSSMVRLKLMKKVKKPSLARASGAVSAITMLSRVLGLVRDRVIATYFGAGMATDAFFVAFKIPNLLRRLVAEGSLATAFVPVFTDEKQRSEEDAKKALSSILGFSLTLTISLSIIGVIFSHELASFFSPGFSQNPAKSQLAGELTRLMFPYIILVSLLALSSSLLNVLGYFAIPASGPAILNIVMISSVLVSSYLDNTPVKTLAIAVLIGGALGLIPQWLLLKRAGYSLKPSNPFKSAAVKKLFGLMLPSILSASLYQIMIFINTVLASFLVEKSVSWLFFADRLVQFPLGVFSLAIATAVLPSFSKHASEKNFTSLTEQLNAALRWMTFITVPATFGLIALSEELISAIYEGGKFTALDTQQTAFALVAFSLGLWAVSCQSIIVRAFLSLKDTLTPAIVSSFTIGINIVLAICLMGPIVNPDRNGFMANSIENIQKLLPIIDYDHAGLALAGSLSSFFSLLVLVFFLRKLSLKLAPRELLKTLSQSLIASSLMYLLINFLNAQFDSGLISLVINVPIGILAFSLISLLIGSDEAKTCLEVAKKRLNIN